MWAEMALTGVTVPGMATCCTGLNAASAPDLDPCTVFPNCGICRRAVRSAKAASSNVHPSGSHSGYMWMHCLFCNHWWKFHTGESYVTQDGELTGEIFIVTKNGITYTLDYVAVSAIRRTSQSSTLKKSGASVTRISAAAVRDRWVDRRSGDRPGGGGRPLENPASG